MEKTITSNQDDRLLLAIEEIARLLGVLVKEVQRVAQAPMCGPASDSACTSALLLGTRNREIQDTEKKKNAKDGELTAKQIAERLQISVQLVTHLVRSKRLECIQVSPRVRRFTESQLERFLRTNTVEISDGKKEKRSLFEPKKVKREASGKVNWVQEVRKLCP